VVEEYGLEAGQMIRITDTTKRNINQDFLIQRVSQEIKAGIVSQFKIVASSTLFGIIELLQQLLKKQQDLEVDENELVENIIDVYETCTLSETFSRVLASQQTETCTISDTLSTINLTSSNFVWADAGGNKLRWSLGAWA
jgi:EamA domain-containing membrane protein RarD